MIQTYQIISHIKQCLLDPCNLAVDGPDKQVDNQLIKTDTYTEGNDCSLSRDVL